MQKFLLNTTKAGASCRDQALSAAGMEVTA
jgi:hypothetical protein